MCLVTSVLFLGETIEICGDTLYDGDREEGVLVYRFEDQKEAEFLILLR